MDSDIAAGHTRAVPAGRWQIERLVDDVAALGRRRLPRERYYAEIGARLRRDFAASGVPAREREQPTCAGYWRSWLPRSSPPQPTSSPAFAAGRHSVGGVHLGEAIATCLVSLVVLLILFAEPGSRAFFTGRGSRLT
jgi:hypothetical protein